MTAPRRCLLPACTAVVVVFLDQALKAGATRWTAAGLPLPLVGEALVMAISFNPGSVGGLWAGFGPAFGLLALAAAVWLLILPCSERPASGLALGLVAGGAGANGLDRMRLGGVVDWLVLGDRLAFNVADLALLAGAVLGVAAAWRSRKEQVQRKS